MQLAIQWRFRLKRNWVRFRRFGAQSDWLSNKSSSYSNAEPDFQLGFEPNPVSSSNENDWSNEKCLFLWNCVVNQSNRRNHVSILLLSCFVFRILRTLSSISLRWISFLTIIFLSLRQSQILDGNKTELRSFSRNSGDNGVFDSAISLVYWWSSAIQYRKKSSDGKSTWYPSNWIVYRAISLSKGCVALQDE